MKSLTEQLKELIESTPLEELQKQWDEVASKVECNYPTMEEFLGIHTKQNPIERIDWKELKKQKLKLLWVINYLEKLNIEGSEELEGILNLIDHIQDYAVDVLGMKESEVFNLEEE